MASTDDVQNHRIVSHDPPPRKKSVLFTVCPFILANEFCERLAYYGLSVNLVNYLVRKMHLEPSAAAVQVSVWMGVCYTTPLLGAYLADSVLGRYKTILFFSTIYVVGMTMISVTALVPSLSPDLGQDPSPFQSFLLYASLYTVALGTGGIKPCVAAFGADQFDESKPRDRREKESFFNWFYFTINVGSLMGSMGVVYVQERLSLGWGLAIPAAAMLLAVFFFVLGSPLYRHVAPSGSPIVRVFKVVGRAITERRRAAQRRAEAGKESEQESLMDNDNSQEERLGLYVDEGSGDWLNAAARAPVVYRSKSLKWLDAAIDKQDEYLSQLHSVSSTSDEKGFTVQQVEEVKLVLRLLPVWLTTMGYWAVFSQMLTTFVEQGGLMNTRIKLPTGWVVEVPAASLFSVDTIAVVLIIPAYDAVIEPTIRKMLGKKMTLLQKIGTGLVIAMSSMLAAAAVEHTRLARVHQDAPTLSILWQIPQFFLVGASEVFASVGQLEFFYDQAPDVMRSFALALQLSSVAMGSYMSGALVVVARWLSASFGQDWLPRDLNTGRLDLFFLFIAGALGLNVLFFLYVAVHYEYKAVQHTAHHSTDEDADFAHQPGSGSVPSAHIAIRHQAGDTEEDTDESSHLIASRSLARLPDSPPKIAPRAR